MCPGYFSWYYNQENSLKSDTFSWFREIVSWLRIRTESHVIWAQIPYPLPTYHVPLGNLHLLFLYFSFLIYKSKSLSIYFGWLLWWFTVYKNSEEYLAYWKNSKRVTFINIVVVKIKPLIFQSSEKIHHDLWWLCSGMNPWSLHLSLEILAILF